MLRAMRVEVTTWSLETTSPSELEPAPQPLAAVEIRQAEHPSPELGRFLYTAAGGNWYWVDRLAWTYERWVQRLSHPRVETWLMYSEGTPVAYYELDGSLEGDVEIAYLGVLPAFMGQRLGGWLLTDAIHKAWAMGTRRVWVHTCSLDAPHALANYRARGMRVFKEQVDWVELPEEPPGPWPGAGVRGAHTALPPSVASRSETTP
jgi:GNAT superfamily N-acetyltransferase